MTTPSRRSTRLSRGSADLAVSSSPRTGGGGRRTRATAQDNAQEPPSVVGRTSAAYGGSTRAALPKGFGTEPGSNFSDLLEAHQHNTRGSKAPSETDASSIRSSPVRGPVRTRGSRKPATIPEEAEDQDVNEEPLEESTGFNTSRTFTREQDIAHHATTNGAQDPAQTTPLPTRIATALFGDGSPRAGLAGNTSWFKHTLTSILIVAVITFSYTAFTGLASPSFTSITSLDNLSTFESIAAHTKGYVTSFVNRISPYELSTEVHKLTARLDRNSHDLRMHQKIYEQLSQILPHTLVLNKGPTGELEIPDPFFKALVSKANSMIGIDPDSNNYWEAFINANQANMNAWFDGQLEAEAHAGRVVTQAEFIKMIDEKYEDHKSKIDEQLKALDMQNYHIRKIAREEGLLAAHERLSHMPEPNLQTVAHELLLKNLEDRHRSVNFFSYGSGARTDPLYTSPTFEPPVKRDTAFSGSIPQRAWRWVVGSPRATSKGSNNALTPWNEAGDCWCAAPPESAAKTNPEGKKNPIAQLGVLMPHRVNPTHVVIEHIPIRGTLDPAAAPRAMELWVPIADPEIREAIKLDTRQHFTHWTELAHDYDDDGDNISLVKRALRWLFTEDASNRQERKSRSNAKSQLRTDPVALDDTYVRLAAWRYDLYGPNHIQTIPLDVNIDHYARAAYGDGGRDLVATDRAVVTVQSNWGQAYTCLYRVRLLGYAAEDSLTQAGFNVPVSGVDSWG